MGLWLTSHRQSEVMERNVQQVALCELSFFPGTDMGQAIAQVVAMSDRAMSRMPKGTLPPFDEVHLAMYFESYGNVFTAPVVPESRAAGFAASTDRMGGGHLGDGLSRARSAS